jgi:outer membrane biosynthesis protein TonB
MSENANIVAATRKELFSVECTTCKARLKVRSMAAVGQILSCPKCQSMVMIAPPADWHPEGEAPPVAVAEAAAAGSAESAGSSGFMLKLAAVAGGASLLCGLAVYAIWRQFPPETPTAETVAQAPLDQESTPAPAVAEDAEQSEHTPESVETEEAVHIVEQAVVDTPLPTPEAPQVHVPTAEANAEPVPAVAVEETPAEPETPAVDPAPEPAPEVVEASSSDDVLQRLQTTVAGIDEPSIRLDALAELLGGLAACPITLDAESLQAAGVSGETVATVQVEEVSIAAALTTALEPLGLTFEPRGKAIVIVAAEK